LNVIVFGGSGFLGKNVVEELMNKGHNVIIADLKEPKITCNHNIHFLECNITNLERVKQIISSSNGEVVYNFAALADLDRAIINPKDTMQINVVGNLNVLEACRENKIKHFIYASSVYACSDKASFYGISKLTSESLVEEYQKKYGLNYTVLRYGSLYGPYADKTNGMYCFLEEALKGKIIHNGTGKEVREYIHAKDASRLSVNVIMEEKFKNQTYVLTGVEPICQSDLFRMIKEILGGNLEVEFKDIDYEGHYKYTPYAFRPTVASKLSPNPYVDLGQGIVECLETISNQQVQSKNKFE
jgi:UDP-glucose 4-epimerase